MSKDNQAEAKKTEQEKQEQNQTEQEEKTKSDKTKNDDSKKSKQENKKKDKKQQDGDSNEDYLELSQRIQAEFDNYRRRTQKLAESYHEEGKIEVIKALLPVLDSFKSAKKGCKPEQLVGLKQVENQLNKVLKGLNVEKIPAENEMFDPNLHEAVMTDENASEDIEKDTITEVLQDGYKMDSKIIRYSMVKIKS